MTTRPINSSIHRNSDDAITDDDVLRSLRVFHEEQVRRDQGMVLLAVRWVELNPGVHRVPRAGVSDPDLGIAVETLVWEELQAKGCPLVDDFSLSAFADAAGLSDFQARNLVREGLMLVYLLPKVWNRVLTGHVEVWRARKLAAECWISTPRRLPISTGKCHW